MQTLSHLLPSANSWARALHSLEDDTNTKEAATGVFTYFSMLPPEIRIDIWKWACFIPRVITVVDFVCKETPAQVANRRDSFPVPITDVPPSLFLVNKESRRESQKYVLPILNTNRLSNSRGRNNPLIFINSEVDILWIHDLTFGGIQPSDLPGGYHRRLAIPWTEVNIASCWSSTGMELIIQLGRYGVQELVLVVDNERDFPYPKSDWGDQNGFPPFVKILNLWTIWRRLSQAVNAIVGYNSNNETIWSGSIGIKG